MKRTAAVLPLVVAVAQLCSCDRNVGTLDIHVTMSPSYLDDPFTDSVSSVSVRIEASDIGVITRDLLYEPGGASRLPEIPVGDGRVVTIEALSGGEVLARGRSLPFRVREGNNRLDIYVARLEEFSDAADNSEVVGIARGGHHAVVMADGRVMLVGGRSNIDMGDPEAEEPNGTEPVAGASIFDPTSGRIVAAGACSPPDEVVPGSEPFCLRTPRLLEATGRTERGDVLVAGGVTLAPEHLAGVAAQIERLSPQGSSFGTSGDPSTDRREAALVAIPGGAILIGGRQGESDYLVSGLLFDESGESWELIPDLLNEECARAGAAVAVVGERILLFGGTGPDRETGVVGVRRDLEILAFSPTLRSEGCFDLDDGDVTARTGAVATAIDHRFVMVAGGVDEMGVVSDEVDVLDLENYLFCRAGVLELARYDHAAAPLPNGNVLVVGGTSGSEGHITAEVVDTSAVLSALDATGSCDELRGDELTTEQERLAQQRIAPTATLMGNDMVLVAGGFDATGNALGTCEIYVPPLL